MCPIVLSYLSSVAIRCHALLAGHLVGPHLDSVGYVPPFSQLLFTELSRLALCFFGADNWTIKSVLLSLSSEGEQGCYNLREGGRECGGGGGNRENEK